MDVKVTSLSPSWLSQLSLKQKGEGVNEYRCLTYFIDSSSQLWGRVVLATLQMRERSLEK